MKNKFKPITYILLLTVILLQSVEVMSQSAKTLKKKPSFSRSKDKLAVFRWMIATWKSPAKNGNLYEVWNVVNDSTFQSKGFLIKNTGDTLLMESVKIECKQKQFYYTSTVQNQNNQQPVPFKITSVSEKGFTAENAEHDFPQRISYERKSNSQLYAFIDGTFNGKYVKKDFHYEKAGYSNKEIVMKLFTAFNKHDWKTYANCYTPDAEFLDPSYGKEYVKQTTRQLIEKYSGFEKAIPDIRDDIKGIYEAGEKIIVEFISSGTLPDGKKMKLPICTIFTIKDGKIIRDATYFDNEE